MEKKDKQSNAIEVEIEAIDPHVLRDLAELEGFVRSVLKHGVEIGHIKGDAIHKGKKKVNFKIRW